MSQPPPANSSQDMVAPRRILMTADTMGGVWNYAIELARALENSGTAIALATMGAPLSQSQRTDAARLSNLCVFESTFKLEWMNDAWPDVERAGRWLLELEQRLHPDLVHLNGYSHAALSFQAPKLVVAHSCVLSRWSAVNKEAAPASWDRYREEVARGLRAAALVVAPTQTMLSVLKTYYGWSGEGVVVPNGRDSNAFAPGHKTDMILCAGRLWDEAKNFALVQNAAPAFSWPVYAAGDSSHPEGGVAAAENVRLLGQLPPRVLSRWMSRAAIFVAPAKYEPFGLAILEAALSGCALVLGDIESLREIWDGAALFVQTEDPAQLINAVEHLVSHQRHREKLARNARARALQFSRPRMLSGYLGAYSRLLGSSNPMEAAS